MAREGYSVVHPDADDRRDYRAIYDVSGASDLLNTLIGRLARGGEVVLAGFYDKPLSFTFPPAFMREARLRVAAEWAPVDLAATTAQIESGALSLDGLITHPRLGHRSRLGLSHRLLRSRLPEAGARLERRRLSARTTKMNDRTFGLTSMSVNLG